MRDDALHEARRQLLRATRALGELAAHAIVSGGLVPFLYRESGLFDPTDVPPLGTSEVDWLFSRPLPSGRSSMRAALNDAGFTSIEVRGFDRKARSPHILQEKSFGDHKAPVYFELLTPRRGSSEPNVVALELDLHAQVLSHMDLLGFKPIEIALHLDSAPAETTELVRVQLPQPAMYIVQKVLARETGRRANAGKAEKDLAYIYDVVILSRTRWAEQRDILKEAAALKKEWKPRIARALDKLGTLFGDRTASPTRSSTSRTRQRRAPCRSWPCI